MILNFEYELENAVIPYLIDKGYKLSQQVPLSNRLIDLAAIDDNDFLVCIEFKLNNWRKALEQASKNKNSFDYVYICLPNKKFSKSLLQEAKKMGVGIIIYNAIERFLSIKLDAKKNQSQWIPNKNYIRNYILNRDISWVN